MKELVDSQQKLLMVEELVPGADGTFIKFTNNSDYFNTEQMQHVKRLVGFSEFSYEQSKQTNIIADLQGFLGPVQEGRQYYQLTDPAIHTIDYTEDFHTPTNHHEKGIKECLEVIRKVKE